MIKGGEYMGIASLVLGIVSVVLCFIPCCLSYIVWFTCIIGFVLGLIDLIKKNQTGEPKGQAIAGVVLNATALPLLVLRFLFLTFLFI